MHTVRWLFVIVTLAGWFAFAAPSIAQDDAVEPGSAEVPENSAAEEAEDVSPPNQQDNFIPTEKINVDSEISFPVDI